MTKPLNDMRLARTRPSLLWAALAGAGILLAGCAQTTTAPATGTAAAGGGQGASATAGAPAPERDAAAIERVKQMSAYLRSLKSFQVTAQTTKDEVLETGQKIQFGGTVGYRYVGPDKLRAFLRTDRVWRDFYYDGKTLTQVAPRMNYYASVPVTGSVGSLTARLANEYDVELPLADLFTWGSTDDSVNNVTGATLIGPATVGGVDTDHIAMRQAGVDWQVWVQRGAQPLPRKIVITTTDEAQQPQYSAVLTWHLTLRPTAAEFTFKPSKGAVRITQVPVAAQQAK